MKNFIFGIAAGFAGLVVTLVTIGWYQAKKWSGDKWI